MLFLPELLPELKNLRQKLRKSSGKLNLLIMSITFLDWSLPLRNIYVPQSNPIQFIPTKKKGKMYKILCTLTHSARDVQGAMDFCDNKSDIPFF